MSLVYWNKGRNNFLLVLILVIENYHTTILNNYLISWFKTIYDNLYFQSLKSQIILQNEVRALKCIYFFIVCFSFEGIVMITIDAAWDEFASKA